MKSADGLTKNDSGLIGFVTASLFRGAITLEELRAWCVHVICKSELPELPHYMFDLCDYNDSLAKIFKTIGFVPIQCSEAVERALFGIAVARGNDLGDWAVTKDEAAESLRLNPQVLKRFRETFPFIEV